MKLHLPAFLRKAVLACLAALALPVTIGSGVAFMSSAVALSFLGNQQAAAIDLNQNGIDDEEEDALYSLYASEYGIAPIAYEPPAIDETTIQEVTATNNNVITPEAGKKTIIIKDITGDSCTLKGGWNGDSKAGTTIKFEKDGSNTQLWGNNGAYFGAENAWFTATGGAYVIKGAPVLKDISGSIYIEAGVNFNANGAITTTANILIGDVTTSSLASQASNGGLGNIALWVSSSFTTTGDLTVNGENSKIGLVQALTVGQLNSDADMCILMGTNGSLTMTKGGTLGSGVLRLYSAGNNTKNLFRLGEGATLSVAGIASTATNNSSSFETTGEASTLVITGADETSAVNVTVNSGVQLQLAENAHQSFSASSVLGGATLDSNSVLSFSGANNTVSTLTGEGQLSLASGSALTVGAASIGSLALGGDVTISMTLTEDSELDFGSVTGTGAITLEFSNLLTFPIGEDGFELVKNWAAVGSYFAEMTPVALGRKTITFENGWLLSSGGYADVTWDGSKGPLAWATEGEAEWDTSETNKHFFSGDNVFFTGSGVTVTVTDTVTSSNMTVRANDGATYIFDSGTIQVEGALSLESGNATFNNSVVAADVSVSGGGTLKFDGSSSATATGSVLVTGHSTLEFAGTGANKNLGAITVDAGSEVVVSVADGWADGANNNVSGEGALVLSGINTAFSSGNASKGANIVKQFLSETPNSPNSLNELVLRSSDFSVYTNWSSRLNSVRTITVESGASLGIGQAAALGTAGHRLIINGTGFADEKGALYADASVGMAWDIALDSAATISTKGGGNGQNTYTLTLNGSLDLATHALTVSGGGILVVKNIVGQAGDINVNAGTLQFAFVAASAEKVAGDITLAEGTSLQLGHVADGITYKIGGLKGSGTVSVMTGTGDVSLSLDYSGEDTAEYSNGISSLKTLSKSGSGTQSIAGAVGAESIAVTGGELLLTGAVTTQSLSVANGKLSLSNSAENMAGVSVALEDGATLASSVQGSDVVTQRFGAVTLSGQGNTIDWTENQEVFFASLSGSGQLDLGTNKMSSGEKTLHIGSVEDFSGELRGAVSGASAVYVGNISQSLGTSGRIAVTGGVHVMDSMQKTGEGSFQIGKLIVDSGSELYMNYEGAFSVTSLQVQGGATLHYSTGSAINVLDYKLTDLQEVTDLGADNQIRLDIWDISDAVLTSGVCLGISSTEGLEELNDLLEDLESMFTISNDTEEGKFALEWRNEGSSNRLYLTVTEYHKMGSTWDDNWGVKAVKSAPNADQMAASAEVFVATDKDALVEAGATAADFTGASLELGKAGSAYLQSGVSRVRLTDGPTEDGYVSIIGGELYNAGETPSRREMQTFISLLASEEVHYHLLVGGSSRVSDETWKDADGRAAGITGDSHIQMQGGTVDYIVGGNHVTNNAFTFRGDSYISVFEGRTAEDGSITDRSVVNGGIVGGSTVTRGAQHNAANRAAYEFYGASHIYVYTVLNNPKGENTPAISDGTPQGGQAFTAIVGGNAWINLPEGSEEAMSPMFYGESNITIDLTGYQGEQKSFEKAIVGGNYTAAFAGSTDTERSTRFESNGSSLYAAHIVIKAGDDIHFTAGINGASRRASSGRGQTIFDGNTLVEIDGGTYEEAIAGGFWFDETASNSHTALLTGNTDVLLQSGNFWRVAGGSYSLGGGSSAAETKVGDSRVVVKGGSFRSKDGIDPQDIGFVAGGDFYRNNAGDGHVRTGNSYVEIYGGDFEGVHIVGGDYANFSAGEFASAAITGDTVVWLNGGSVTGLLVGGSYLTDEGKGGSVSVGGRSAVFVNASQVTADPQTSLAHRHNGVAIVGGHMVVDSGSESGSHMATVDQTAVYVMSGVVNGHIVGGSYSSNSDGQNTLSIASGSSVSLLGGSVFGNVYGGHFSANIDNPDKLELDGEISVVLDGASVKGNIVGGSYRMAERPSGSASAPRQGAITVSLLSGVLDGHVYAAGWNNSTASVGLSVTTESTRVEIGSGMQFAAIEGAGASVSGATIVSGGYYKAASGADASSVLGDSVLVFSDNAEYQNVGNVNFVDFNIVSVEGKVALTSPGQFYARNSDLFTKTGAGELTLDALRYLDASGVAQAFTGEIAVLGGGSLCLASDQSVEGGLRFDLTGGTNSILGAYLQALEGQKLSTGAATSVDVAIETGEKIKAGVYYLANGFEDESVLDVFHLVGAEAEGYKFFLEMREGSCLVLRVRRDDPQEWIWDGDNDGVWDSSSNNWTREEGSILSENDTVYFEAGAASELVVIKNSVSPGNVHVIGGGYTFIQGEGEGGLNLNGTLYVGNAAAVDPESATLRLDLANTKVPHVVLRETGTLTLADPDALNGNVDIDLAGGVLAYAVDEDGKLLNDVDLSAHVVMNGEMDGSIRVMVGEDKPATINVDAAVTWGSASAKHDVEGIRRILDEGLEKSGNAGFTVEWQADENELVAGAISVEGGWVRYSVHSQSGNVVSMTGDIHLAEYSLAYLVADSGTLSVSGQLSGAGAVSIGSQDSAAAYEIGGDNTGFAGSIALVGSSTSHTILVKEANALGGRETTLALNGRHIVLAENAGSEIAAGTVFVYGENYLGGVNPTGANSSITLLGNVGDGYPGVAGQGVLVAVGASSHTIQGSVTGFSGTLVAKDADTVWTLGNENNALLPAGGAQISTNLTGNGKVTLAYQAATEEPTSADSLRLSGEISGNLDLENASNMTVVIAGNANNSSTGKLLATGAAVALPAVAAVDAAEPETATAGGNFQLGTATEQGFWAGSVLEGSADKSLTLVNGALRNGISDKGDMQLIVDTSEHQGATAGATVEVGGASGALFNKISLGANTRLSGLSGDIVVSSDATDMSGGDGFSGLQFGSANIGQGAESADSYLIGSNGGNLIINDLESFTMDFSNDGFLDILKKHRQDDVHSYLHVLSGGGSISFGDAQMENDLRTMFRDGGYAQLLEGMKFRYVGVDGGDIILAGSSSQVYLVLSENDEHGEPHLVNEYGRLDSYLATVVDEGESLTIEVGDDTRLNKDGSEKTENNLVINNLVGLEGASLTARRAKGAEKDLTITLNNDSQTVTDDFGLPEGVELSDVSGIDTEFEGLISSDDAHVHFNKRGQGTLTVGSKNGESGGIDIQGNLTLSDGGLVLRSQDNFVGELQFAHDEAADGTAGEKRSLTVRGGQLTVKGGIHEQGAPAQNSILLENGGELRLKGASDLANTTLSGQGGGTLKVMGSGSSLRMSDKSSISGVDLELSDSGRLSLADGAQMNVGKANLGANTTLDVGNAVGNVIDTLVGDALATISGNGGALALSGSDSVYKGIFTGMGSLSVQEGASLTLKDVMMPSSAQGKWNLENRGDLLIDVSEGGRSLHFGELTLASGSQTRYVFDSDRAGSKYLLELDALNVEKEAHLTIESIGRGILRDTLLQLGTVASDATGSMDGVDLAGLPFLHYTGSLLWQDGKLFLNLKEKKENSFLLPAMEKNACAGAQLFWDATGPLASAWQNVLADPGSDMSKMNEALEKMLRSGDIGALSRTLAAGAGASISTLGSALSQDLQRQLSAIRTRTASIGSDASSNASPGSSDYHMWINGETSYHKLDADGLAPGYTLSGWGGAVGMDVEISPSTMIGLAVSAMYNDLKTSSADNGKGDMDTTYLSIFGRKAIGSWMHTLVVSAGVADVTLNRTVYYGSDVYSAKGSTDGYAVGFLYEVGYSKVMNAAGTCVVQPVFNIELRHGAVKGYTETGSDAGLRVDDISQDIVTFGLGARLQRLVGENVYNRSSVFEARALLKADAGDKSGSAQNALINGAARTAEVESAEVGAVGIELGAGVSIPVGARSGAIFFDASVELRKNYTNMDANVGYRINF